MQRLGRAGGDDAEHGFGLGEVEAAVGEGAQGEFARFGGAGTGAQAGAQHFARGDEAAVALEFDHLLAGVGARRGHADGEGFVDRRAAVGVDDRAVDQAVGGEAGDVGGAAPGAAEDFCGDGGGFGSADSHDADAALAERGGDGGDGVSVHGSSGVGRWPLRGIVGEWVQSSRSTFGVREIRFEGLKVRRLWGELANLRTFELANLEL
ncbi:MAG: hypothetical protein U0232_10590 [Thermomicrobiales bacterium]